VKGWLRLDLVRLAILALPAIVAHGVLVAWAPPAARPAWMLALAVSLAVISLLLLGALRSRGPRTLGPRYLAFFLAYVFFFALAADMDLLAGRRTPLTGYSEERPSNALGLGWLEDWHYALAPRAPEAQELLVVTFPSFEGRPRERVRQELAFLIRHARRHGARGLAFDVYLEKPSHFDERLRRDVEEARAAGFPVVFGARLVESEEGLLVRQELPPELEAVAEYRGHLQGYREADGRVRLVPAVLLSAGRWPALSVTVAELLAERELELPDRRLVRFVRPRDGVATVPFSPDLEGAIFRGRFVIVGSASPNDRVDTPWGEVQGVEVHAWSVQALFTRTYLVDVDPIYILPLIFALSYVLTLLYARGFRRWRLAGSAAALSIAVVATAVVALRTGRLWLEVSYPLIAIWLLTAFFAVWGWRRVESEPMRAETERAKTAPRDDGHRDGAGKGSFDVFLSYKSQDRPAVREVAAALRARGLSPWLDRERLVPGREWQGDLEEVLRSIPAVAVMVGSEGLGTWQIPEIRGALSEAVRRDVRVVPVLLPGAEKEPVLPLFLTQYTWVDLSAGLSPGGIDRLVWGITGQKPRP